jgi:CRP-like cAMP-binding protein
VLLGAVQGEIALLTDQPRLATVTAVSNTSLLELDKGSFMAVFAGESSEALADFELRLFRCCVSLALSLLPAVAREFGVTLHCLVCLPEHPSGRDRLSRAVCRQRESCMC